MSKWTNVKEYEALYLVSDNGRIFSIKYNRLRKIQCGDKYPMITLSKSGKCKTFSVHRLMMRSFGEIPFNGAQVNHINGNRHDNRLSNLEWVTREENLDHAEKMGLLRKGSRNENAKLNEKKVRWLKSRKWKYLDAKRICKILKVSKSAIAMVRGNRSWRVAKPISGEFLVNQVIDKIKEGE